MTTPDLFTPFTLGRITLPNRVVMAPMTRNRATGNVPNALHATYYSQRADAGLIFTEGTAPDPNGLGYARIPGMFSDAQVAGWRAVTDAVHAAGGHIFVQLMHTGRASHADNLPPGARVVGPSAVPLPAPIWVDPNGNAPATVPHAMTEAEIGKRLFRSRETVHTHVRRIYATLNVRSRIELVRLVLQGVVPERNEEVAMLMPNPAFRELKPDPAGSTRA